MGGMIYKNYYMISINHHPIPPFPTKHGWKWNWQLLYMICAIRKNKLTKDCSVSTEK